MFSLAYAILPFSDTAPAEAIAASLARFQRGARGDVPDDWLQFDDDTAAVEALHRATFTFTNGKGLRIEGGESWDLNSRAILEEMKMRGRGEWTVRFLDIEPDITAFARQFLHPFDRHPVTGGFGHWLNSLGRWDWWELGGRFNGVITGNARGTIRGRTSISSGESHGRTVLEGLQDSIAAKLGEAMPAAIDIVADDNTELVETLALELAGGNTAQLPGALILPPGAVEDHDRWIENWPQVGPESALTALNLTAEATWTDVVQTTYSRFADHWAAGMAFHH